MAAAAENRKSPSPCNEAAMATRGPLKQLCEELTCSFCLEYFNDPVTIAECGHSFCRDCLIQSWAELEYETSCPLCKVTVQTRNLRTSRQLANVVEIAKELSHQEEKASDKKQVEVERRICEKHQEPFKFFCQQDQILICMACHTSKGHRSHEVVPLEEASQEYKDKFHANLKIVNENRANLLAHEEDIMKESKALLERTKSGTRKTVAEFRKLRQFLEEQEKLLLGWMVLLENEIARERAERLDRVSCELSSLGNLIWDIEEKQQQPALDLLQDVRSTLKRYEETHKFGDLVAFPPELKQKICGVRGITDFLEVHMKRFKDSLASGLHLRKGTVNMTLDPDTAQPQLFLSEDRKSITLRAKYQELPRNPERFDKLPFVMGCAEFTAGQHFWEVIVGNGKEWAVGVARNSMRRKGVIPLTPEEGVWAVGRWRGGYYACEEPFDFPLSLSEAPKRILVSLNYEGGRVTFLDADRGTVLYEFSGASFSGETLRPFFYVMLTPLRLSP